MIKIVVAMGVAAGDQMLYSGQYIMVEAIHNGIAAWIFKALKKIEYCVVANFF